MDTGGGEGDKAWKKFVRRHGKVTILAAGGTVAAAAAALLVFLWVVADTQATGRVPSGLGAWTVGHVVTFLLQAILWEALLVASWVIPIGAVAGFRWYLKLPLEERRDYEGESRRTKSAGRNGGMSLCKDEPAGAGEILICHDGDVAMGRESHS